MSRHGAVFFFVVKVGQKDRVLDDVICHRNA
jgi:hypothetical protein